jgi:hypothetical protein
MLKVLTIKSNKLSENKRIKGKDNIFAGNNDNQFGAGSIFDKGLKPIQKKSSLK